MFLITNDFFMQVSHSHSPSTNNNNNLKVKRKCGYIISVISPSNFIGRGAQPLNFQGVYYIKKNYTFNNPSEETLALVGIPLSLLHHFYDDGPNEFIAQLRARPELEFVQDVHELFWPFFDILKMFREFFELSDPTLLLLLNIEPKGTGRYQKLYPRPRFTFPGGTMEDQDNDDFFKCAQREFQEETQILLTSTNYSFIEYKKLIRDCYYNKKKYAYAPWKIESVYFALKLI